MLEAARERGILVTSGVLEEGEPRVDCVLDRGRHRQPAGARPEVLLSLSSTPTHLNSRDYSPPFAAPRSPLYRIPQAAPPTILPVSAPATTAALFFLSFSKADSQVL